MTTPRRCSRTSCWSVPASQARELPEKKQSKAPIQGQGGDSPRPLFNLAAPHGIRMTTAAGMAGAADGASLLAPVVGIFGRGLLFRKGAARRSEAISNFLRRGACALLDAELQRVCSYAIGIPIVPGIRICRGERPVDFDQLAQTSLAPVRIVGQITHSAGTEDPRRGGSRGSPRAEGRNRRPRQGETSMAATGRIRCHGLKTVRGTGWLHTGDIGFRLGGSDFLYVLGRFKRLLIRFETAKKYSPKEWRRRSGQVALTSTRSSCLNNPKPVSTGAIVVPNRRGAAPRAGGPPARTPEAGARKRRQPEILGAEDRTRYRAGMNLCRGVSGNGGPACGTGHCRRGFHAQNGLGEQQQIEGLSVRGKGRGAFPKPASTTSIRPRAAA